MDSVYRVGIIGCGRIGCSFDDDPKRKMISTHAGAYHKVKETELVALCDIDKEKLEKYGKKYHVDNLYKNSEKMLKEQQLDIVSICTLQSNHHELVKAASDAGIKAIFCEKPISENITQAKEMIMTCKRNGTILMIDHQRRFQPLYQKIREIILNGKLGQIQKISYYYTAGINNTGSHVLDSLRFFFGDVDWVMSIISNTKSNKNNDPNIDGMIKFKNGALAAIQSLDSSNYLIFEQDMLGSKGRIRIGRSGYEYEFFKVKDSNFFSEYKELYKVEEPLVDQPVGEPMLYAVKHLVECIKENTKPISNGDDGLAVIELISALLQSASKNGKRVYLPL